MRRFLTSAALLNLIFIVGASAQTAQPEAGHHPAEEAKGVPSTGMTPMHDCPMMQDKGAHMPRPDGAHPPMGQGHRMPKGMGHCCAMHAPAASAEPHAMHPSDRQALPQKQEKDK